MNKDTYLSLKSDLQREIGTFLEKLRMHEGSRERKVQVPESFEIFLCEDLQRTELEEEAALRAWDEFVSDCEILEVKETSSPLVCLQSCILFFSL